MMKIGRGCGCGLMMTLVKLLLFSIHQSQSPLVLNRYTLSHFNALVLLMASQYQIMRLIS